MTAETHDPASHRGAPDWLWYVSVPAVGVVLYLLYGQLIPISEWVTSLFPVPRDSHTGEAIAFFVYDVPKVLLLLTGIVFVTGFLRSWFSPEKTRAILAGKREIWGYPLASLLGVLTPFCSCSSVPLFIGFVSAGIPLGVTFSFLIAGPMVGPVGLGLLYGLVGWEIATIWRGVAGAYAAIHLFGTMPLVLWAIPAAPARTERPSPGEPVPPQLSGREATVFGLMAAMLVLNGLIVVNISTWLFTFLQAQGLSLSTAVALGALIGPAQVGARLLEMAGRGRHHPIWTLAISTFAIAAGILLLAADNGVAGAALVLYGGGNGLFSIARGALPLAVFGADRYPAFMGSLARPSLIAQAAAPLLGAWLLASAGPDATLWTIASLAIANTALLALLWRAIPE